MSVNPRERFLAIAHFMKSDIVPVGGAPRKATLERWFSEGLPRDVDIATYFKFDPSGSMSVYPSEGFCWSSETKGAVNLGPIPPFEFTILDQNKRYRMWIDGLGIKQRGFTDDWESDWSGFATRQFLEFPVKDREDFTRMKLRYRPELDVRYPPNWSDLVRRWKERKFPLGVSIRGPFWWSRDMMGLLETLRKLHKEPRLMHEIMQFCVDFHIGALHKGLDEVEADFAMISEDMAYKAGPMLSPAMAREFLFEPYTALTSFLREHGVETIIIDSDGNCRSLIPLLVGTGINGISPCEVAAGMDIVTIRREYPRLVIMGGIDKRRLAEDEGAIALEVLSKVPFMLSTGGYFPSVDHAVPPDVSLKNFKYYLSLTRRLCGWAHPESWA